jgi:hypothetical protein
MAVRIMVTAWKKEKGTNHLFSQITLFPSFTRLWPSTTSIFHGLFRTFEDMIFIEE